MSAEEFRLPYNSIKKILFVSCRFVADDDIATRVPHLLLRVMARLQVLSHTGYILLRSKRCLQQGYTVRHFQVFRAYMPV